MVSSSSSRTRPRRTTPSLHLASLAAGLTATLRHAATAGFRALMKPIITARSAVVKKKFECRICMEKVSNYTQVHDCNHQYCLPCLRKHVEHKLSHQAGPPRCPHAGCATVLQPIFFIEILPQNQLQTMEDRLAESAIAEGSRIYCPNPTCSALMSKSSLTTRVTRANPSRVWCAKCQKLFCSNCIMSYDSRTGHSCSNTKKDDLHLNSELKKLAEEKQWRRCVNCNHMIELHVGCYHVICRCGHEFCYKCGTSRISKTEAGSSCPLWIEANIVYNE